MSRPRPEDMEPSGATDGQVLTWDDALGLWVPADAAGGGGSIALDDLADVDTASTPPSDGDRLSFDSGSGLWVPAAPADGLPTGGIAGDVLTKQSGTDGDADWEAPTGGGVTINDRRWVRGSTAHAQDDEFNDSSLSGSWGRVDAAGGTGRATWTEDGDSLSLLLVGGDAAGELHGMVRNYALAVGEAIQCHMITQASPFNFPHAGLVVSTGNTHGGGTQSFFNFFNAIAGGATFNMSPSDWTGWNTRTAFAGTDAYQHGLSFHMRLKRSATSTWQFFTSPDGVSWFKVGTDRTLTLAPNYVGFAGGTYGGTGNAVFSFDYFRVI